MPNLPGMLAAIPLFERLKEQALRKDKVLALILDSDLFDETFYFKTYGVRGRVDGVKHYFHRGWREGHDPSADFSTVNYLRQNPDVAAAGLNPLFHWLKHGRQEGRKMAPGPIATPGTATTDKPLSEQPPVVVSAATMREVRRLVSKPYYVTHYADVAAAGADPASHYVNSGWKEDRNPSAAFDTSFYLAQNPDVRAAGVCPLVHYLEEGRAQGLQPLPEGRLIFDLAPDDPAPPAPALRIGVHAHVFFVELIGELCLALSSLPATTHVRFTTVTEGDRRYVENFVTAQKPSWTFDVRLCARHGRDVGPLFTECADLWRSTDLMIHIHTKRSLHTIFGDQWRQYLYDQCLGSERLVSRILQEFQARPKLAMLYPENFYEIKKFVLMNGNERALEKLLEALGHPFKGTAELDFAAGSMAWFRSEAYLSLVDYLTSFDPFGSEERIEGTLAHVLERAFAALAQASGWEKANYATTRRVRRDYGDVTRGRPIYYDRHADRWPRDTPRIALNSPEPLAPANLFVNAKSLNIHWVIPSFGPGAGGHMTIFRFVELFESFGHRQTIWIQNAINYRAPADALKVIQEHYRPIGDKVFVRFLPDSLKQLSGDVIIATDCWTAYPVACAQNFKERFYFIQDYESEFHAAGANRLTVAQTYDFGFAALCAGPWLLDKAQQHGMWARHWHLAADRTCYFPASEARSDESTVLQIAFYARTNTPRRAVDLGLVAFERLAQLGHRFHVHYFGADEDIPSNGYEATNHGILSPEKLGDLYRNCDIGVVFSATNYSLIPLEMMACGLPVVDLDVESVRAVFTDEHIVMAKPTPSGIAERIGDLINDPGRRKALRAQGLKFAESFSWEKSARAAEAAIYERMREKHVIEIEPEKICAPHLASCRKASVFIPVKDGGAFFEKVIDRILAQKTDFAFDFLVIDSGSEDGTVDLLKRKSKQDARFRFEEIPAKEFQHGRTRNMGIAHTDGEYVAITTADALPADENWLAALVSGFKKGARVAGATGRHLAYPEHGPFLARDMNNSFDRFRDLGDLYAFGVPLATSVYPGGVEWQMTTQFYSDNNSAMSREVWKLLPYPEIDWGEDMVWAWEALKLGFQKAYVDEAVVYHSHAWDLRKSEDWYAIEGRFWMERFGFDIVGDPEQELRDWTVRDNLFAITQKVPAKQLERQQQMNRACVRGRARGAGKSALLD